jgi:hypothetical protein
VLAGMASGTVILALHVAYQVRRFARMRATVEARFPSQRRRPAPPAYRWAARARSISALAEPR